MLLSQAISVLLYYWNNLHNRHLPPTSRRPDRYESPPNLDGGRSCCRAFAPHRSREFPLTEGFSPSSLYWLNYNRALPQWYPKREHFFCGHPFQDQIIYNVHIVYFWSRCCVDPPQYKDLICPPMIHGCSSQIIIRLRCRHLFNF